MLNCHNLLHINKSVINKFTFFVTTLITFFIFDLLDIIKYQAISANNSKIAFYGTDKEATSMGAEYILFENNKNHSARGLVYIQNSAAFSCFQADYDRQDQSFAKIIFAYPKMGTNEWVKNESEEKMSLENFPYQLNYGDVHENAKQLFNKCLKYFEHN